MNIRYLVFIQAASASKVSVTVIKKCIRSTFISFLPLPLLRPSLPLPPQEMSEILYVKYILFKIIK